MSGSRGVDQGVYTAESRRDAKLDAFIALVRLDPEGVGAFISSLDKRPPESWPAYFASLEGPRPPPDPEPSHTPDPATNEADDAMDWATTPEQINSLDNAMPLTTASPATPSSPSRSSSSSSSSATITPDTTGGATNEREKDGMEVDEAASEDQRVASSGGASPQHVSPPASKRQEEKQQPPAKKRKREPSPSSSSSSSSPSLPTSQQSTSSSSSASLLQPAPPTASSTPSTSTSTPLQVPAPPAPFPPPPAPPAPPAPPSTAPVILPSFRRKRAGEVDSLPLDILYPRRNDTASVEVSTRPPPPKFTPNFIPWRSKRRAPR